MNLTNHKLLGITLALVMLVGSVSYSFADDEYVSPRKQVESGVAPEDVQCKENHVLVHRTNGSPACVTEKTAERMGLEIIIKEEVAVSDKVQEISKVAESEIIVLDLSSLTEFVDDGREYPTAIQRSPAPAPMYDSIMQHLESFPVDGNGVATFTAVPHTKYSLNPQQGLYIEDWMPTYIPKGYKLLYGSTSYHTTELNGNTYETHGAGLSFVPSTYVLSEDVTNTDYKINKGFHISIVHSTLPHDEIGDDIEHVREVFESQGNNYGEGFREMTRDGKTVSAYAGGNGFNPYQAALSFYPDEFTSIHVTSSYHTLDELIPIFESVMK